MAARRPSRQCRQTGHTHDAAADAADAIMSLLRAMLVLAPGPHVFGVHDSSSVSVPVRSGCDRPRMWPISCMADASKS